jgi:hypothetical protein
MKNNILFVHVSRTFFLEWEIIETKFVEETKTHILCSITFFLFRKSRLYEMMWKTLLEPERPQMTECQMHSAWWITKATNTHREYIILITFPLQQWRHESQCTLSIHCLSVYCWLCCGIVLLILRVLYSFFYVELCPQQRVPFFFVKHLQ